MRKCVLIFFAFISIVSVQANYLEQNFDDGKRINASIPRQQIHPQEIELATQIQKIAIITSEKTRRQKSVLYYLTQHKNIAPWRRMFVIEHLKS